jgi:tetratricopeptide (TPR) repeat protein
MSATNLQTLLQNADALAARGAFAAAEAEYARARVLAPGDLTATLGHGHVLRVLGRPGEARAIFAAAAAQEPATLELQHGLALAAQEAGDPAAAETAWRTVLAMQPGALTALLGLGEALNQLQRPGEALEILAPLDPRDPQARASLELVRGVSHLLRHDHELAVAHFDRVLAIIPGYPPAAQARAVALQQLERTA